MIKIIDSNVFDSKADCIVNTVNCVGVMGKGLALEFALRYPELESEYIEQCKTHQIKTGQLYFYNINGQKIINFPTKFHFSKPSQMEWIEQGLEFFVLNYKKWNIKSVAFPLLGVRNGGLNPDDVISLIENKLAELSIPVYVCLNKTQDKLSTVLLERFNSCDPYAVADQLKLNKKQTQVFVFSHKKIKRFIDISDLSGIGSKTYRNIYKYFFENKTENSQMNLFEM